MPPRGRRRTSPSVLHPRRAKVGWCGTAALSTSSGSESSRTSKAFLNPFSTPARASATAAKLFVAQAMLATPSSCDSLRIRSRSARLPPNRRTDASTSATTHSSRTATRGVNYNAQIATPVSASRDGGCASADAGSRSATHNTGRLPFKKDLAGRAQARGQHVFDARGCRWQQHVTLMNRAAPLQHLDTDRPVDVEAGQHAQRGRGSLVARVFRPH